MNAKVIDLAPHEWCEVSSSSDISPKSKTQGGSGWMFRCVVAMASAGVGFYASAVSGIHEPATIAKRHNVSIVSARTPANTGLRAASRHVNAHDWRKNSHNTAMHAGSVESEKTRWEMAGWSVRR